MGRAIEAIADQRDHVADDLLRQGSICSQHRNDRFHCHSGVLGVLIGIPALRIRGAQLAVVTLAGAIAIEKFVFRNPKLVASLASGKAVMPISECPRRRFSSLSTRVENCGPSITTSVPPA